MMLETGKQTSLRRKTLQWAGLVSCALYLVVASDAIYAFPTERLLTSVEVLDEDECADMVCSVRVNDEGKSTCCCNPDGEDSSSAPVSVGCVLKDCSSPQDREGTEGPKTTKPVPQSTNAVRLNVPAASSAPGYPQTNVHPAFADIPDKIPI